MININTTLTDFTRVILGVIFSFMFFVVMGLVAAAFVPLRENAIIFLYYFSPMMGIFILFIVSRTIEIGIFDLFLIGFLYASAFAIVFGVPNNSSIFFFGPCIISIIAGISFALFRSFY